MIDLQISPNIESLYGLGRRNFATFVRPPFGQFSAEIIIIIILIILIIIIIIIIIIIMSYVFSTAMLIGDTVNK